MCRARWKSVRRLWRSGDCWSIAASSRIRAPSCSTRWFDVEPAALLAEAGRFRKRLREIRCGRTDISWYPYDPLNSLTPLAGVELPLGNGPIADIGCADGDLSFFLESLGYEVDAIDNAATGANALAGFKALAEKLGSRITLHDRDLDVRFELPRERYSFVFFLGILYHLKNPFGALEALAHVTPHMLLSTRVAQRAPDGTPLRDLPVAYLLDERETNNDPTNYWIFSETGLRRMLTRALWNICAWTKIGATRGSDPVARDERVFCLLESRVGRAIDAELVRGWHDVEEGGWRWTERTFAARL